jgi:cobalamin biosynthesis protein CobT
MNNDSESDSNDNKDNKNIYKKTIIVLSDDDFNNDEEDSKNSDESENSSDSENLKESNKSESSESSESSEELEDEEQVNSNINNLNEIKKNNELKKCENICKKYDYKIIKICEFNKINNLEGTVSELEDKITKNYKKYRNKKLSLKKSHNKNIRMMELEYKLKITELSVVNKQLQKEIEYLKNEINEQRSLTSEITNNISANLKPRFIKVRSSE